MRHEALTQQIIGIYYSVYNELGGGFLESVYESAMMIALEEAGLQAQRQVPIAVWFHGQKIGEFVADILVQEAVLLELKAVRALEPARVSQLLNYLRATPIEVGLLFNFGPQPDFKRYIFDNARKIGMQSDE